MQLSRIPVLTARTHCRQGREGVCSQADGHQEGPARRRTQRRHLGQGYQERAPPHPCPSLAPPQ